MNTLFKQRVKKGFRKEMKGFRKEMIFELHLNTLK